MTSSIIFSKQTFVSNSLLPSANAIRFLAIDAIQNANSGHPGMPMGMAEIAVALWQRHLRYNPQDPHWPNRDRFILSNGHGSMLLYAVLHLTGYDISIEDLRNFRKLHSKTPGHPELSVTTGVETTTGPLGQGLANAVGIALSEELLANEFNKDNIKIIDHYTYVFVGDGCLMEGISHEACSLAGTLGLSKLIVLYDNNGISIDGQIKHWFADNTPKRFESYGWNVIQNIDGHNVNAVDNAICIAKISDRPTLICCNTIIGCGAHSKAGKSDIHGSPLGEDEITATRKDLNWPYEPFVIPQTIYKEWDGRNKGKKYQDTWQKYLNIYSIKYPNEAKEFKRRISGNLPDCWEQNSQKLISIINDRCESISTRQASQQAICEIAKFLPELLGGSADLTSSNLTNWKTSNFVRAKAEPTPGGYRTLTLDKSKSGVSKGNYINFGVREFAMSAIINGIALYGGYIPFGGTFLTFSDYSRNALRIAALMKIRSLFIFTHDSIGLGEDGPTHQPIEHITSLRIIPGLNVWRPSDSVETIVAWTEAILHSTPTCLILSRQNLTFNKRNSLQISNIKRGGYILNDWDKSSSNKKIILLATGSEVQLAMKCVELLKLRRINVRVVSMPSTTVFDRQDITWRKHVLPTHKIPCIAIEAGITDFWRKYVGLEGNIIGVDTFGESASGDILFKYFGFTVDNVINIIENILN